jgi:hypothetical protein
VQERKGGSESRVNHSAKITQFCLKMSSSGSQVNVNIDSTDGFITTDTYLSAREEWGIESRVLHSGDITSSV